MDTKKTCSSEKEQDWIQKYRAALDMSSADEFRPSAMNTAFSKAVATLRVGLRFILRKPVWTMLKAAVFKRLAKTELVRKPTMSAVEPRKLDNTVGASGKGPAPRWLGEERAS